MKEEQKASDQMKRDKYFGKGSVAVTADRYGTKICRKKAPCLNMVKSRKDISQA